MDKMKLKELGRESFRLLKSKGDNKKRLEEINDEMSALGFSLKKMSGEIIKEASEQKIEKLRIV